jgi:hypothetical protein
VAELDETATILLCRSGVGLFSCVPDKWKMKINRILFFLQIQKKSLFL